MRCVRLVRRHKMNLRDSLLSFDDKNIPIHSWAYRFRRLINWFPLGLGYASLVFMRYNLNALQSAIDADQLMTLKDFSNIFGVGSAMYVVGFLFFGPIIDRLGGRWGMIVGLAGTILSNLTMGVVVEQGIKHMFNPTSVYYFLLVLYSVNMFFQSLGAMAIVTTKMPWFHVRERGTFSTIFGIMITLGIYFAFDWGYAIKDATRGVIDPNKLKWTATFFRDLLGSGGKGYNESWWIFLFPALFGLFWLVPIVFTLRNKPEDAGFKGFDTGDDHISDKSLTMLEMLKEVFLNPKHRIVMIICAIELCSGAIRNGVMQYYPKFAEGVGFKHDFWFSSNWGLVLLVAGFIGANATGWVSDKVFGSRRGPMAFLIYVAMMIFILVIVATLGHNNYHHGSLNTAMGVFVVAMGVIGVHGILSGTAAADFTGVKNTGKAVGIVDGAVYVGTSLQSFATGFFITPGTDKSDPNNWIAWPLILVLFVTAGTILSFRIINALPKNAQKH